jgi:DNA (cytosine-5)-methyltransferase 1
MAEELSAISLYSGAGGLDAGFAQAGFRMRWANDFDPWACATYRRNLGDHIVCGDVLRTRVPVDIRPDLVIGGPPCQGFSVIGRMHRRDPRSQHVFHFLDVVEQLKAHAFVLENVKALATSPRWEQVRQELQVRAGALGFSTQMFVLNAADFDVPQNRERMFLVGIHGVEPLAPTPVTKASRPRVRDALAALPRYGEPGNDSVVRAKVVPASRPVMRPTPFRGSLLFNGSGRPLDLDVPAKTLPASMGGNATPIIDQEELDGGAEPWVVQYHRDLLAGYKPRRRAPRRLRRLTVQEAAALQTFPPEWVFEGPQVAQLRQIGNAVPPNLAFHVATAVKESLVLQGSRADLALVA